MKTSNWHHVEKLLNSMYWRVTASCADGSKFNRRGANFSTGPLIRVSKFSSNFQRQFEDIHNILTEFPGSEINNSSPPLPSTLSRDFF